MCCIRKETAIRNDIILEYTRCTAEEQTWSPKACLPMVMACVQPVTSLGMFLQMIGSRKTVPPRIFLMVPLGLFHILLRLNSVRETNWVKTSVQVQQYKATNLHAFTM